jgi:hypothetical protein
MRSLRLASRLLVGIFAIVVCVGAVDSSLGKDPPKPEAAAVLDVEKAEESGIVYFAINVRRPADMRVKWSGRDRWWGPESYTRPPGMADLCATPPWDCPCYYEKERSSRERLSLPQWTPTELKFVGRCTQREAVELRFRYVTKEGEWKEVPAHLDLAGAKAAEDVADLRQRWAEAQVSWFEQYRLVAGDFGGFLAYAQQQTRREYALQASPVQALADGRRGHPGDELMFDVTTGALAVQESLQLDRMTNATPRHEERTISIKKIKPVEVKSHPFDEMRGDQEPVFSDLARLVPADNYYLRFNTLNRLRELLDFANEWGPSLLRQAEPVGVDYDLDGRTRRQLCLPDTVLSRLLGPAVIKELAITGSDPYVREGADITILFNVRSREIFQKAVDQHFREAAQQNKDAVEGSEQYRDITVQRLVSPRRTVSCFRCWLGDVCVYGNSLAGLSRVIDVYAKQRPSLAGAADFRYMRAAVYPFDEKNEDGFLYLSDEFIRRLVGPELRIKEKRRLEAVTSLKMLENAVLFHGYKYGPGSPTMDQLVDTGCLRLEDLYDPEGGEFSWDAGLRMARSTMYGDMSFLTPLVEIEADLATALEVKQYGEFRENYESYWRDYFDPIGVRIKVDQTIRLELCILPLINLSAYNDSEDLAGGKPISIDLSSFNKDTLFRVVGHFNDGRHKDDMRQVVPSLFFRTNIVFDWLGDWFTFWVEENDGLMALLKREYGDAPRSEGESDSDFEEEIVSAFDVAAAVGAQVKNPMSLAAFLVALPVAINNLATGIVEFNQLEPYKGVPIIQIAPKPKGAYDLGRRRARALATQPATSAPATTGPATRPAICEEPPALYYGNIDDGFYISTSASAMRGIIDRKSPDAASQPRRKEVIKANLLVYVAPGTAEGARPCLSYYFEQQARRVSLRNTAQVYLLGRCGAMEGRSVDAAASAHLGCRLVCPDGGTYAYDASHDTATCSIHGSLYHPIRLSSPPAGSPLSKLLGSLDRILAYLRFTKDGLETTLEIRRR